MAEDDQVVGPGQLSRQWCDLKRSSVVPPGTWVTVMLWLLGHELEPELKPSRLLEMTGDTLWEMSYRNSGTLRQNQHVRRIREPAKSARCRMGEPARDGIVTDSSIIRHQAHIHPQPAPCVLSPKPSTLTPHRIPGDTQAQAKSAIPRPRAVEAGKGQEDPLKIRLRHAATLILQPQVPEVAVAPPTQMDDATLR